MFRCAYRSVALLSLSAMPFVLSSIEAVKDCCVSFVLGTDVDSAESPTGAPTTERSRGLPPHLQFEGMSPLDRHNYQFY